MNLKEQLEKSVINAVKQLYNTEIETADFQETRKEFEGDITLVVFSLLRFVKGNPVAIGTKIGEYLVKNEDIIINYNVVKGFLNLVFTDEFHLTNFNNAYTEVNFGYDKQGTENAIMVEYSSPNTNKPLHLGHIRNNLLGYSVAEILKAAGNKVYKTQIINDRGIHICKSMLAWKRYGNGETPESTGLKGDKLVGNYYVRFDQESKKEITEIMLRAFEIKEILNNNNDSNVNYITKVKELLSNIDINSFKDQDRKILVPILSIAIADKEIRNEKNVKYNDTRINPIFYLSNILDENITWVMIMHFLSLFENIKIKFYGDTEDGIINTIIYNSNYTKQAPILLEAQQMLQKWEAGDDEVVKLWKTMNQWVYDGFEITYKNLGVDFDKLYYESETYLLGKEFIAEGLKSKVFFKKEDGSVWCDLTDEGLDEKIVLRSDGTAVYMTQDIGTAIQRIKDYPNVNGMVYTVGNEQDYHFKVLFLILKKLGFEWSKNLFHLSYGMVDLPEGKMKSREGTVVDADDLMNQMTVTAKEISEEKGKLEGYSTDEKEQLYKIIGLGALKYYILKVDPKKRILFNPKESIDFAGNTGPFIQYTYARIQSILRKADFDFESVQTDFKMNDKEKTILKRLQLFPEAIQLAAKNYSPAIIANYTYDLVKEYNSFFQSIPILSCDDLATKIFRTQLSKKTGETIKLAFDMLGIDVPERM